MNTVEIKVERYVRDSFGRRVAVLEAFLCRCRCKAFRVVGLPDFFQQGTHGNLQHICLECHTRFKVSQVRGRVSPDHKCDAKCRASKGLQCECSCGGKNHGSNS